MACRKNILFGNWTEKGMCVFVLLPLSVFGERPDEPYGRQQPSYFCPSPRARVARFFSASNLVLFLQSTCLWSSHMARTCLFVSPPSMFLNPVCLFLPLNQVGLPSDKAQYIHRLGRTARAGKGGHGVLLLCDFESVRCCVTFSVFFFSCMFLLSPARFSSSLFVR